MIGAVRGVCRHPSPMARKVSPKSRAIWLIRRVGRGAYPALVLAAVFALAVAFVHDIGYDGVSERDSVSHIAEVADANRDNLRLKLQDDAKDRWRYLWGLLNGRDSEWLHEPFGSTELLATSSQQKLNP